MIFLCQTILWAEFAGKIFELLSGMVSSPTQNVHFLPECGKWMRMCSCQCAVIINAYAHCPHVVAAIALIVPMYLRAAIYVSRLKQRLISYWIKLGNSLG